MERDFKQEFIELKQNEIPDLWNRIEAGLSEKKVTASVSEKADSSFKKINWRRWGTLAAACLCVAIIIPAISLIIRNSEGKHNNTTSIMYENTYSGSSTAAEDCATSDEPEMNGDSDGKYTADTGSMHSEDKDLTGMTQADGVSASPSEAENTSITANTDEEARAEDSEAIKELDLKDGQIIENVIVQIVDTDFSELSGEEIIYQAIVLEPDADATFTKNMQIEIVYVFDMESDSLNTAKNKLMKERESYEVSLCFEQDKFVLTDVSKAD